MRIRPLMFSPLLCVLVGCPGSGAAPAKLGTPPVRPFDVVAEFPGWPEALPWLKASGNPAALASNRFNSTGEAVAFVERLYRAGALRVAILPDSIWSDPMTLQDEGGPYTDTIVVKLPEDRVGRARVLAVCRPEFEFQHTNEAEAVSGDFVCLFWD